MDRFEPQLKIAEHFGLPLPRKNPYEGKESMLIPTIGAEIEIPWRCVIPDYYTWFNQPYTDFSDEKRARFNEVCEQIDARLKKLYEFTVDAGIPKGRERYHEFAHNPVNWHGTLADEINLLFDAGLIPSNQNLPLHLTVGGIPLTKKVGILAFILESVGGSTGERIRKPYNQPYIQQSWNRKGTAGLKERSEDVMQGRYKTGTEIRTLVANTPEQVRYILYTAQMLGASILHSDIGHEIGWANLEEIVTDTYLAPMGMKKWFDDPSTHLEPWNSLASFVERNAQELKDLVDKNSKDVEAFLKRSILIAA